MPMNDQSVIEEKRDRFFTPQLFLIFLIVFIDLIGFGMVIPVLPIYAQTEPFYGESVRDRLAGRGLFLDAVRLRSDPWEVVG